MVTSYTTTIHHQSQEIDIGQFQEQILFILLQFLHAFSVCIATTTLIERLTVKESKKGVITVASALVYFSDVVDLIFAFNR